VSARRPSERGASGATRTGAWRWKRPVEGGRVSARRPSERGASGATRTGAWRGKRPVDEGRVKRPLEDNA
jgi:hypothetical protein